MTTAASVSPKGEVILMLRQEGHQCAGGENNAWSWGGILYCKGQQAPHQQCLLAALGALIWLMFRLMQHPLCSPLCFGDPNMATVM